MTTPQLTPAPRITLYLAMLATLPPWATGLIATAIVGLLLIAALLLYIARLAKGYDQTNGVTNYDNHGHE